jgi:hypothetical protein
LLGCIRPGTTNCPPATYPLISSAFQITACRSVRSANAAGACSASYTPLCDMRANSLNANGDGLCAATDTLGCVASFQFSACDQLTSNSKYPTAVAPAVQVGSWCWRSSIYLPEAPSFTQHRISIDSSLLTFCICKTGTHGSTIASVLPQLAAGFLTNCYALLCLVSYSTSSLLRL